MRTYKVSQRLTILEQGLNERSESVRKVVVNVLLRQWTEAYHKDYIALINALKLDNNEKEINRFRKISQQTLEEIFKYVFFFLIIFHSILQIDLLFSFYFC